MARIKIKDQGLPKVVEQLCSIDGVLCEDFSGDRSVLELAAEGGSRELEIVLDSGDYRVQKNQYDLLCRTLIELGIPEGATYTPPPPPRRGMTPQIRAARERQKQVFEAWQEAWRMIRKAEKALDVDYEIAQMKDYY